MLTQSYAIKLRFIHLIWRCDNTLTGRRQPVSPNMALLRFMITLKNKRSTQIVVQKGRTANCNYFCRQVTARHQRTPNRYVTRITLLLPFVQNRKITRRRSVINNIAILYFLEGSSHQDGYCHPENKGGGGFLLDQVYEGSSTPYCDLLCTKLKVLNRTLRAVCTLTTMSQPRSHVLYGGFEEMDSTLPRRGNRRGWIPLDVSLVTACEKNHKHRGTYQ